ncbi:hypothetical protein, partial [Pseudomonas nunensis]|uniref:hypothetical protein n=1 Tax=Pseudomonas nunensis TaxID=2961896 RepID=UPI0025B08CFD
TVKVVQTVGGVSSDASDLVTLKVKPPKPAITLVPQPIEGRQVLTITGVAAGTVTLTMQTGAGGTVLGDFTGTGTTRTFTPAAAWTPPGEQTVKVVQTVGGVPSDPSDVVTLKVRPPKPGIEPPGAPIEASQPLTVMGIYSDAVTLKMLDDDNNEVTGSFTGSGAQRDFTPDPAWAEGEHHVTVVQTLQNITSAPSDLCSFIVEASLKPPLFEVPVADSNSSSSPQISGASEPFADVTVRHVGSQEQLFHGPADADGYWAFVVKAHLPLGPHSLQAMQALRGQSSVWGEEHPFIVIRTPVSPPTIERPLKDSTVNPVLWFSGSGVVNAQVNIRVKQDGAEKGTDRVPVNGSRNWTSRPSFRLPSGVTYTLEVKQQYGADESGWTVPAVPFKVSASTFEFAEAGPVIGQPVVSNEESVWLRVRAVSADTGLGVGGLEVRWYLDEQDVLATTLTEADGWTRYRYRPATVGEHTVWADMSAENAGVAVVQPFMLTAVENDVWAREFDLLIDGERLDLTQDIVICYGQERVITLEVKPDSPLIGATTVSLKTLPGTESSDFMARPPLGTPVPVDHGNMNWWIEPDTEFSGFYGLKLSSPKLPDRQLPVRVISRDLANEVDVLFDGVAMTEAFGKGRAYPCHGATHSITIKPKPGSRLLNSQGALLWGGEPAQALGISLSPAPAEYRTLGPDGFTWTLDCSNSLKDGVFSLRLMSDGLNFVSSDFTLSLGHNSVEIVDRSGPTQINPPIGMWTTAVRVASTVTGQFVSVPVQVRISLNEPFVAKSESDGWCRVFHEENEYVYFTLNNQYAGRFPE